MKKALLLCLLTLLSISTYAAGDIVRCLALAYANGEEVDYFALSAEPIITYVNRTITVTQEGENAYSIENISLYDIARYYFEDALPTSNSQPEFVYVVDPKDGSIVEKLDKITFSNDYGIYFNEDGENGYDDTSIVVFNASGEEVSYIGDLDITEDGNGNVIAQIVKLEPVITEAGECTVAVPASFFYVYDENGEKAYNDEITLTYTIEPEDLPQDVPGEYTFDPENGKTLESLSEFIVAYSEGIDCSWKYVGQIVVTDNNDNVVAHDANCKTTYPKDDQCTDGLYCTITLDAEISTNGSYTITIPEGYFIVGKNVDYSEALEIMYIIENEGESEGISEIEAGNALMTGLKEGEKVYVYTTDGQTVINATAGKDGRVGVDINSLKGGQVYILRTPSTSYKIVK